MKNPVLKLWVQSVAAIIYIFTGTDKLPSRVFWEDSPNRDQLCFYSFGVVASSTGRSRSTRAPREQKKPIRRLLQLRLLMIGLWGNKQAFNMGCHRINICQTLHHSPREKRKREGYSCRGLTKKGEAICRAYLQTNFLLSGL